MKNKFIELYNLILEELTNEQEKELNQETEEYFNSIDHNPKLTNTNLIPTNETLKNELKDEVQKSIQFGSASQKYNILEDIIKKLDLNLDNYWIEQLLNLSIKYPKDFKVLLNYLNEREKIGLSPDDITNGGLTIISEKLKLPINGLLTEITNLEGKKNGANVGRGELLLALVLKNGKFGKGKGDVVAGNYKIEMKTNRGAIIQTNANGPTVLRMIKEKIKDVYLKNEQELIPEFNSTKKWFNFKSTFNTSNGLPELLKKQFPDYDNEKIRKMVIQLLKYGISLGYFMETDWIDNTIVNEFGLLNFEKFSFEFLKHGLLHYARNPKATPEEPDAIKFTHLGFYDQRNKDISFYKIADINETTNRLLQLSLSWPSFGTSAEAKQADDTNINLPSTKSIR